MNVVGNGNHIWKKIFLALLVPVALGLIGYGALQTNVSTTQQRLAEEVARAPGVHDAIEARVDAKLSAQRELILTELRDISRRLERIERKLP